MGDRAAAGPCGGGVERHEASKGGHGIWSAEVEAPVSTGEVGVVGGIPEVGAVVDRGVAVGVHDEVVKCRPVGLGVVPGGVHEGQKPEGVEEFVHGNGLEVVIAGGDRVVGVPVVIEIPVDRSVGARPVLVEAGLDFPLHGGLVEPGSHGNPAASRGESAVGRAVSVDIECEGHRRGGIQIACQCVGSGVEGGLSIRRPITGS